MKTCCKFTTCRYSAFWIFAFDPAPHLSYMPLPTGFCRVSARATGMFLCMTVTTTNPHFVSLDLFRFWSSGNDLIYCHLDYLPRNSWKTCWGSRFWKYPSAWQMQCVDVCRVAVHVVKGCLRICIRRFAGCQRSLLPLTLTETVGFQFLELMTP